MKKLLIVEDDPSVARGLRAALKEYDVRVAPDGEEGFRMAQREIFNCIILDRLLPGKNGIEVCRDLREAGKTVPILMLTCRSGVMDKVTGLEAGADDYVTKPFSIRELLARVRALERRSGDLKSTCEFGDVAVDFRRQEVFREDRPLKLSPREF